LLLINSITRAAVLDSIADNAAIVKPVPGTTNRFICSLSGSAFVDSMKVAMKAVQGSASSDHFALVQEHISTTFEAFLSRISGQVKPLAKEEVEVVMVMEEEVAPTA
jgi:hypothetical protein